MRKRQGVLTVGVVVATLTLSGCGTSGTSTTCGSFTGMSPSSERSAITNALRSEGESPTPLRIDESVLSAKGYCFTHGADDTIGNIFR